MSVLSLGSLEDGLAKNPHISDAFKLKLQVVKMMDRGEVGRSVAVQEQWLKVRAKILASLRRPDVAEAD